MGARRGTYMGKRRVLLYSYLLFFSPLIAGTLCYPARDWRSAAHRPAMGRHPNHQLALCSLQGFRELDHQGKNSPPPLSSLPPSTIPTSPLSSPLALSSIMYTNDCLGQYIHEPRQRSSPADPTNQQYHRYWQYPILSDLTHLFSPLLTSSHLFSPLLTSSHLFSYVFSVFILLYFILFVDST